MANNKAKGKKKPNRKQRTVPEITGHGAYKFRDLLKSLGSGVGAVGKALPKGSLASLGAALGGPSGGMAGAAISKLTGFGSYDVENNSIMSSATIGTVAENIPTFSKGGHGSRIYHREFIRPVVAPAIPASFTNEPQRLGIDNTALFPWLASLSARYQRYKVHGMVFQYRSTSTDYLNSGTVAMAVNYNATERPYASLAAILNSQFACSSKPSMSFFAPVECDPDTHPDGYYIRHEGELAGYTDLRMSSVGTLNFATQGLTVPAGTVLGELWVTYEIELISPYLGNDFSLDVNTVTLAKTWNVLTDWTLGVFTDLQPETPRFVYPLSSAANPLAELVISQGTNDANFSRPRITANFQTGTRTYLITYNVIGDLPAINWMPAVSQAQALPMATELGTPIETPYVVGLAGTRGTYSRSVVVRFEPGDTYSPWAAGISASSATLQLMITRSGLLS